MVSKKAYASRMGRLREALADEGLGGVVVVPGPNMKYLTGVESLMLERPIMLMVPSSGEPQLVSPELEAGPYRGSPTEMQVHAWTDSMGSAGAIASASKAAGVEGRWGAEGRVPFLYVDRLRKAANPELTDAEPLLQGLREVKDEEEVALLKKSAKILSRSFEEFPELIKEGRTELEIARRATDLIYSNGGTKVDDMLVQSGERAANPHGLPSSKKVRKGEGVIIDVGTTYEGYYADITRTYTLGKAKELEGVYEKVLEAEEGAIGEAKVGARVGKVDGAARGTLKKAGMGKFFIHRTGHGLGLEVHEAPYIVERGKERLREGMCFTVEPGVYIKGRLGVRIEDNLIMGSGKAMVTTDAPKEFGWWK